MDVVDASVAVKWYFPERGRDQAIALLHAQAVDNRELLAPDLIVAEFTNALRKKVQREECRREQAFEILDEWSDQQPELIPSSELAARALELSLLLHHPVYDCLYIAAAIVHDARLVTADARMARAARTVVAEVELLG